MLDGHKTQDCLGKADFQLSKTWYILRKSGYGEILSKKCGAGFLKVDGVIFISQLIHYFLQFQGGTSALLSSSIE